MWVAGGILTEGMGAGNAPGLGAAGVTGKLRKVELRV